MKRQKVLSPNIRSIGWSSDYNVLEVEFINDFIYQYYYITKSKYLNLMHSPSIETGLLYLGKIHPYRRVFP